MSASRFHEADFYAWANEQAALLRSGRFAEADIAHVAEEIESMGKTAYATAVIAAARETSIDLRAFPATCPWSYEQIIDANVWPDAEERPSPP